MKFSYIKFSSHVFVATLSFLFVVQLVGCTKSESPPAADQTADQTTDQTVDQTVDQTAGAPAVPPNVSEQAAKPAPKLCSEHQFCAPLREFEKKCREGKKEADCKTFVENFEKLSGKTDCQRSFDTEPVSSVWLCDMDPEEVDYPKLHERSAATLSKLKFKFAKKFYGSEEFRSTLDGALSEDHREASEKASQSASGKATK